MISVCRTAELFDGILPRLVGGLVLTGLLALAGCRGVRIEPCAYRPASLVVVRRGDGPGTGYQARALERLTPFSTQVYGAGALPGVFGADPFVCGTGVVAALPEDGDWDRCLRRVASLQEAGAGSGVVLLLDTPLWSAAPERWLDLRAPLEACGGDVYVVSPGPGELHWWRDGDGLTCIELGDPGSGAAVCLWFSFSGHGVDVRPLEDRVFGPWLRENRAVAAFRQALRDSLSVTSLVGYPGSVTVSLGNPADIPLDFTSEWVFSSGVVLVEPEVLGFRLGPGETFTQTFRLSQSGQRAWSEIRPSLELSTAVSVPGHGQVPFRLTAEPLCPREGQVTVPEVPSAVDGVLGEWPSLPNRLSDPGQRVSGPAAGLLTGQVESSFAVAVVDGDVVVALRVRDRRDFPPNPGPRPWARLALAWDGGTPLSLQTGEPPGPITASGEGLAVTRDSPGEWAVEFRHPFPPSRPAGTAGELLLLDLMVGIPNPDGSVTALRFSGRDDQFHTAAGFGRFRVADDGAAAPR